MTGEDFSRSGFLHLGQVLTIEEVEALQQWADDLATEQVKNQDVQMQLDTDSEYEKLTAVVSHFQEATRFYRKIQGLAQDPFYFAANPEACICGGARKDLLAATLGFLSFARLL